jgi:hypothetical protein
MLPGPLSLELDLIASWLHFSASKMGISFDEFEVGQKFESYKITVTEAHVVLFASLTGDFNPLHVRILRKILSSVLG